jgi:PAS domain S-box-containing protein
MESEDAPKSHFETATKRKLELEKAVSSISLRFIGDFDLDSAIDSALSEIGKTTVASCCCLFLLREDGLTIENTHKWCEETVAPQIEELKKLSGDMFALWRERLSQGRVIYVRDTSDMPAQIRASKEVIEKIGVKSLVVLPVFLCRKLGGFLGLCFISERGRWSEDDLSILRVSSDLIGRALEQELVMEALRESEERFRSLTESTSDWIWQVDENAVYTYASPKVKEILGYEPEEILGKTPFDLMPPDEAKRVAAEFESIVKGQKAFNRLENVNLHKDGRLVVLETSGVPVFDEGGNFRGYRGIDRDITERKRVEEALRESEEKYRNLFLSSPGSIVVVSSGGTVIDYKGAITRVSGLPREEIIGKSLKELAHLLGGDLKQWSEIFSRLITGENLKPFELSVVRQDGQKRWVEVFPSVLRKGEKIWALQVISEDITERKQAEERLKESEQRFRAIFDNAVDGLLLADPIERTFHGANKMICQMLGYSKEELSKLRVDDIHPKEALLYIIGEFEKQYRGETIVAKDAAVKRKDGSVFYADISASVVTLAGKEYLLGIFRDITERKEAEERLRAHEVRLRTLASELSLAEERERRQIAADLHDHTSQALAVAKIKLAALEKEVRSENLAAHLEEIRKLLEETIEHTRALTFELSPPVLYQIGFEAAVSWLAEQFQKEHGISCQFEDDWQSKPLDEDVRTILFKATRELLLNITKHAKAKKARLSVQKDDEAIRVTVQDDGIGFDTSAQDPPASATGGFGLFSIRERLNYIGGQVEIYSGPGRGTRVTLTAPLSATKKLEGETDERKGSSR